MHVIKMHSGECKMLVIYTQSIYWILVLVNRQIKWILTLFPRASINWIPDRFKLKLYALWQSCIHQDHCASDLSKN